MTLLSVRGLYLWDDTLFDEMTLPDALNRDQVKAGILMECAELEVWLPDPDSFKQALKWWSKVRAAIWQHLYETTQYEYNPIWNKDGVFSETERRNLASSAMSSSENKVSAYNSNAYQNSDQNSSSASGTDTGTISRSRSEHGNIGITSTQQLIKEEREVAEFDIYAYIVRDFKERFCVCVY